MLTVSIYILDQYNGEYNRVELFDDEKISLVSSIQNINDISKTFTDFSQTFTIPASKQNNKIFKHWYENSLDNSFSTLVKSDAYIELDTIPFRKGKIQLESCSVKNGQPQDYSITFIGALGSLKDKFAGLLLKDLNTDLYDFTYSGTVVKNKVNQTDASDDVMFPLISSDRYWNYGGTGSNDISLNANPIVFSELFPAIKLSAVLDMIHQDTKWNINFNGSFLTDARFTSAYLFLKNADVFKATIISGVSLVLIYKHFPEIKIEDFFSGILKMFNLTCYSEDGINYEIEEIESYYNSGNKIDITKYIQSDNINLNRVKTYKKINFAYEKSESFVNVAFNSANGVEYGSLLYSTNNDGEEYNIKLPFETLNFDNLQNLLQVGYCLKTDLKPYIPKPIILYDYNPSALTVLDSTTYRFSNGSTTTAHTSYKAFGQEFYNGTNTFSLNFNEQISTLTNVLITNSLYNQYYSAYFNNIFDFKARLIKVSGILPTSLLTTLKLNDSLIIRDKRYIINTFTTDLTTGEVQFELLTDQRL